MIHSWTRMVHVGSHLVTRNFTVCYS